MEGGLSIPPSPANRAPSGDSAGGSLVSLVESTLAWRSATNAGRRNAAKEPPRPGARMRPAHGFGFAFGEGGHHGPSRRSDSQARPRVSTLAPIGPFLAREKSQPALFCNDFRRAFPTAGARETKSVVPNPSRGPRKIDIGPNRIGIIAGIQLLLYR